MENHIKDKVSEILIQKIGLSQSEITDDANFTKDLGIDSLDFAELTMEFEQAFDIKINDNDTRHLKTIGDAISFIEQKLQAQ